jgi:hypothetical protein
VDVTVSIADDIAAVLAAAGVDVPRQALQAFALEELRGGRITSPKCNSARCWG